jgi:hypothetical protein
MKANTGVQKVRSQIEAAIRAAEKSPVTAVNKLWLLLEGLDETLGSAKEKMVAENTKLKDDKQKLQKRLTDQRAKVRSLEFQLEDQPPRPPKDLADAVRGYMRAVDGGRSAKTVARCRAQVESIIGADPKAA